MKVLIGERGAAKLSWLERLARKVEPKLDPKVPHSVARRIKPMKEIDAAAVVFRPGRPPRPTSGSVVTLDGERLVFFSDGSLRHAGGVVRGKAVLKALKRARQKARRR